MQAPPTPVRWLVAANVVWLASGLLAYATRFSMVLGASLAAAVAVPGLRALRDRHEGEARLWVDRAMSFAVGSWAMLLVLVVLPLLTVDESGDLLALKGYWVLSLVVANGGFLLLNASAFRALTGDERTARTYGGFHLALLALSLYGLWAYDHTVVEIELAGRLTESLDLRFAPAFAAVPGVTWALALWRAQAPARDA